MQSAAELIRDHATAVAAIALFLATYLVIAIGKLPYYQLDRAGAALLGASLMVAFGVMSLDQAYRAIDFDTLTLLLGMMIVVANLRLSGFFRLASNFAARAQEAMVLLLAIVFVAGALSAFLVNDAVCLAMTPLILDLVSGSSAIRSPICWQSLASNVGSVATITGNPQNMIIGGLSHIPYGAFTAALWPVAAVGLALTVLLLALIYRHEFLSRERLPAVAASLARPHPVLVAKAVLVTLAMMIFFFAGQPVAKVAIVGGSVLLFTRKVKAEKIYREIDGPLLLMFAGLFVVVAGLEAAVVTPEVIAAAARFNLDAAPVLVGHGGLVQSGQQCSGCFGFKTFRRRLRRSPARLADCRHGLDAGREFHSYRLGRQPDCRATGALRRGDHRLLELFQGWRAADGADHPVRRLDAVRDYFAASSRCAFCRTLKASNISAGPRWSSPFGGRLLTASVITRSYCGQ